MRAPRRGRQVLPLSPPSKENNRRTADPDQLQSESKQPRPCFKPLRLRGWQFGSWFLLCKGLAGLFRQRIKSTVDRGVRAGSHEVSTKSDQQREGNQEFDR